MAIISLFCWCEKVFILMNKWMIGKKIDETLLPKKEDFYIFLNIKDIIVTDADYAHAK